MKILKKIGYFLIFALIISQFFGPEKNEGDLKSISTFVEETNPPENVREILETTCFDCHSNKTTYPWYNKITPVNYWLADHVDEGKKNLNFSTWSEYTLKKKAHKMKELQKELEKGDMPLDSYTWIHKEANLTKEQVDAVVSWGKNMQGVYQQQLTSN